MNKKAFSLVELVVVITILAVLATIGSLSYQGYGQGARDAARLSDIKSMEKVLDLYKISNNKYPTPVAPSSVTYSGSVAWTQGVFGETAYTSDASMSNPPIDPVTSLEYPYSITGNGQEYQLASILENPEASIISPKTYAGDQEAEVYVTGNYNGTFLRVRKDATTYLLGVPGIFTSDTITSLLLEDIITNKSLVYNGYKNLPASFSGSIYKTDGGFDFGGAPYVASDIILFEGNIEDLETDPAQRVTLLDKLQTSYSGSVISNQGGISELLSVKSSSASDYVAVFLNNILDTSIAVTQTDGFITLDYPGCDTGDITVGSHILAACNVGTSVAGLTTASYGGLYQWGNNNNFRNNQFADGENYTPNTPGLVASASSTFVINTVSPYDWISLQDDDLWGDITDTDLARRGPCATGYHVPTEFEWDDMITTGGWGTNATAMSSALQLPLAGGRDRDNANLIAQGAYGFYLSSSSNGPYSLKLIFYSSTITTTSNHYRSNAYSLRCFKNY